MEKEEPSYTAGGSNVNWYNYYGDHYGGHLENEKKELP